ncbi:AT-rich interactive domain-containing protein 6-like isoform X2 [Actinidia eriantha]|uniref:AT-rich interactive domain-containing protein 6-like isoform X2 n=1 Tax=Actinidia eriantha TaxID=165200 RepID=UPI002590BFB2|nr:AT-rich interactive domain-containing protein 6-like isoform X2 [Actinidia eriantha]
MTDWKTEDDNEMVKDTHGGGVSNDRMMIEAEIEKEELDHPEETYEGSPHSNAGRTGNNKSPPFEAAKVLNNHGQNIVATAELHAQKHLDHPDTRGLELPKEGSSMEEKGFVESSVFMPAKAVVDPAINANIKKHEDSTEKADGKHLDPSTHSDSIVPVERSLKTQTEDEMVRELKKGLTGKEFNEVNATEEEELNYGGTTTDLPPKKTKDKSQMEFLPDNEIMEEELNVGVTDSQLCPDMESKEEELQNAVTRTELPPDNEIQEELKNTMTGMEMLADNEIKDGSPKPELDVGDAIEVKNSTRSFLLEPNDTGCDELGTEEEQASFMKELETFHKERCLEFKPPKFYGEPLNCLKLWRAVIRLGGYEQVTSCKLWRQVGESFRPPKTCTTVSWTFRCFYEKALLEYEKHKMRSETSFMQPGVQQASGSGRARRDAAARAMQGWHSQRLLGNGEVGDPIIKDKNSTSTPKREKQLKNIGLLKRKKPSPVEHAVKAARLKASKAQSDTMVVDIGHSADWVKINVQRTRDCFEVYALVPGLLREEVRVQSDPAGRLVISGQPEQLDNPWGVIPFKKVVSLPSRIDPHQTSAVVTLHGQLFVRVPFEQSDL